MEHAKEIIAIDVYSDTIEIIEDCLDELQPFIDDVIPEKEKSTDFSEDDYMDYLEAISYNSIKEIKKVQNKCLILSVLFFYIVLYYKGTNFKDL